MFTNALEGQTLVLTGGACPDEDLTIDGDQNNDGKAVTIDGNHASRILTNQGTIGLTRFGLINGQTSWFVWWRH